MGQYRTTGIYEYDETDNEATFSELLNLGTGSVSDSKAYFAGTMAQRDALTPPPGGMWQDTDGEEMLWSAGPNGEWRQHEGSFTLAQGPFSSAGGMYGRSLVVTLPTTLASNETLLAAPTDYGGNGYTWSVVNTITRNVGSTDLVVRQMAATNSQQPLTIAWRIVKMGS